MKDGELQEFQVTFFWQHAEEPIYNFSEEE
jgi:hypothetical protein